MRCARQLMPGDWAASTRVVHAVRNWIE